MVVSETLLGVIVGGLFTLAGSVVIGLIHYFRTQTEVRAENNQLNAEVYLEQKAEALISRQETLNGCHAGYIRALNRVSSEKFDGLTEIERAVELTEELRAARHRAGIFLTEEQEKTLEAYTVMTTILTRDLLNEFMIRLEVDDGFTINRDGGGGLRSDWTSDLKAGYEEITDILYEEMQKPIDELE